MEACLSQKRKQRQFSPKNPNTGMKRNGYGDRSNKINKNHQRENALIFFTTVSLLLKKMYARSTGEFVCEYCDLKGVIIIINYYYIPRLCSKEN